MQKKRFAQMIPLVVIVFSLTALLAACAAPSATPTPSSYSGSLSGTVAYRERIALPENASVMVTLLDVSKMDVAATEIASVTVTTNGQQVPIPFTLTYDPTQINEGFRYEIHATILVDGKVRWSSQQGTAVLTQGNPADGLTLQLVSAGVGPEESFVVGLPEGEFVLSGLTVDGEDFALIDGVNTTISFGVDGRYSGNGGCNGYSGSYTVDGSSISLGMAASTLKACLNGQEQENAFFAALGQLTTYEVTADGLTLSSEDGSTVAIFTK